MADAERDPDDAAASPPPDDADAPVGPSDVVLAVTDWRAVGLIGLSLLGLVLFVPPVRTWAYLNLGLPVVADVLGRQRLVLHGRVVEAHFPFELQVAFAAVLFFGLVALRAVLLVRQRRGSTWAGRIRVDSGFVLSLTPFLALGAVLAALETAQLFHVPFAFLVVPPVLFLTVTALALASLLFGLWIEDGPRRDAPTKFLMALFVFVSIDLFAIGVLEATTRAMAWWAVPAAMVLALVLYHGSTLGNRLVSHRRALFALGGFHFLFFATFLAMWVLDGAWAAQSWSYRGLFPVRTFAPSQPFLLWLVFLVPMALTVGLSSLGQFLFRYTTLARPWVDGLNVTLFFAHTLDGWVTTMIANDPYDIQVVHAPVTGILAETLLPTLGGWGYFAVKTIGAVVIVMLLDRPFRGRSPATREASQVLRGGLVALGLVPALRAAIRMTIGI